MMEIIMYRGEPAEAILNRDEAAGADVREVASEIIARVRENGDQAALDFTEKFDGVRPSRLLVTEAEIDEAFESIDPALLKTMRLAAERIESFHEKQKTTGFMDTSQEGVILGQRVLPLEKVGIYVPGGTARYPSSVLMNAIPAKLAGVGEIIMTTPPDAEGNVPRMTLAAARLAGVQSIVKLGGAQAVAALAYGTKSVPKVDKVVGPGNAYVAAAKQICYGQGLIDIDMVAGPSEILVIADGASNPVHVAADLLSQAEHDRHAAAWLITDSLPLAREVRAELARQIPALSRAEIAEASIRENGRLIVVDDLRSAVKLANGIAPEHLELCVENPFDLLTLVQSAGSVFLGRYAPEPLGDYLAGPNHTLPTSGTARYASPLGVEDFVKRSSYIYYTKEAFSRVAEDVRRFALHEGLTAHAHAVSVRAREEKE